MIVIVDIWFYLMPRRILASPDYVVLGVAYYMIGIPDTANNSAFPVSRSVTVTGSPSAGDTSLTLSAALTNPIYEGNEILFGNVNVFVAATAEIGDTTLEVRPLSDDLTVLTGNYFELLPYFSVANLQPGNNPNSIQGANYSQSETIPNDVASRSYTISADGNFVKDDPAFEMVYRRAFQTGEDALVWAAFRFPSGYGMKGLFNVQSMAPGGAKYAYETASLQLQSAGDVQPLTPELPIWQAA